MIDRGQKRRPISVLLAALICAALGSLVPAAAIAKPSPNPEIHPFEILPGSFDFAPSTLQAAAHADLVTHFDFAHTAQGQTYGDLRETVVELPPGFTGNSTAVPTCSIDELRLAAQNSLVPASACPAGSQVGVVSLIFGGQLDSVPIYNLQTTSFGITAQFGFVFLTSIVTLQISVRPGDSGLTVTAKNVEPLGEVHDATVTVWGVPASPVHDSERGRACQEGLGCVVCEGHECEHRRSISPSEPITTDAPLKPYLSNPTECASATTRMRARSWEEPEHWSEAEAAVGPLVECERVPFAASIKVQPTTDAVETPSGLKVSLEVPQTWNEPNTLVTSNVRDVRVTLPVGYTVNPSEGNGLVGCTPQQYGEETASSGQKCPPESKLGRVVIETPVLADRIEGNVYLAEPYDNLPEFGDPQHPNGSLLALYVVAKDPARGIVVKSAGKVELDEHTGQLTSTFKGLPQQPFSRVTFELIQGELSPLVSPPACGRYTARASLTPYSAPEEPRLVSNELEIGHGMDDGPCPSGGVPPFSPLVIAGTSNNAAGSYSPFYLRIGRKDGEQEITGFSTQLPPGLTGNLTGIPFCSDAEIEAARHATGAQEINQPSCPSASEIGHTIVGAGVGTVLAQTPGKIYLAGPYHGSALSIVSITSASVGPFDLGTVVIRFALRVNPFTAQVEVDSSGSDPIPHIIDGVVVHVRDIRAYISRNDFTLNPTNCNPMKVINTITGVDPFNPADQTPLTSATPFQAADCANLAFKPVFKASTKAHTSRALGASLTVRLNYPKAVQGTQANIHSVKVSLPKQLPSRLTTLQKACRDVVFDADPAACPPASRVGAASAVTPVVPVPLTGPAYFVSHGGAKFPELAIVLQGYGIQIILQGETFISKQGITSSTFRTIPDQPVTSFELNLPQGQNSALAANVNLCSAKLRLQTVFVAQNGSTERAPTPIAVTGCPKHHLRHRRTQLKRH